MNTRTTLRQIWYASWGKNIFGGTNKNNRPAHSRKVRRNMWRAEWKDRNAPEYKGE